MDLDLSLTPPKIDVSEIITRLWRAYEDKVQREFDSLPKGVQGAFVSEKAFKKAKKKHTKEEREAELYESGLAGYGGKRPWY